MTSASSTVSGKEPGRYRKCGPIPVISQFWTNVEDVAPTLYKCDENVLFLLGYLRPSSFDRGQFVIQTGLYSDRSIFRQVVIPTGRYSDGYIFRQVYIPTGRYSDRSLFRQVYIPTCRYSNRSLFRQFLDVKYNVN